MQGNRKQENDVKPQAAKRGFHLVAPPDRCFGLVPDSEGSDKTQHDAIDEQRKHQRTEEKQYVFPGKQGLERRFES